MNAREPILGVVFGITLGCYGLPKVSQFNVHFLQSQFDHVCNLLVGVCSCRLFEIVENVVY